MIVPPITQYETSGPLELSPDGLKELLAGYGDKIDIRPTGDGRVTITGTKYVGVIRSGGLELVVTPKIPTLSVFWMLGFADALLKFDPAEFPFETEAGLLDVLARLFAKQTELVIRRGLCSEYVEHTENLRFVRGRIQLLDDARVNLGIRHQMVCRFAELTTDVRHNQILREVTGVLLQFDYRLKGIRELLAWNAVHFGEVSRSPLSDRDFSSLRYGRLNAHYRSVHALARLIVQNLTFELGAGQSAAPTFLLNMNVVYEDFLTKLFEERARLVGLRVRPSGNLFLDEERHIGIDPDIVLTDGKNVRAAIDAKYKREDPESDVYQALAYAKALGLSKVALVYPEDGSVSPTEHHIRNDAITVLIRTVPVGHKGEGFVTLERRAGWKMSALISELLGTTAMKSVA